MVQQYVLKFTLIFLFVSIVLFVISNFIELPGSVSGVVTIACAAFATAIKFVTEQKRVPDKAEKRTLVWGCFLSAFLLSTLLTVILFLYQFDFNLIVATDIINQLIANIPLWIIFIGIIISLLIQYCILSYSFGGFAKSQFNKLSKK